MGLLDSGGIGALLGGMGASPVLRSLLATLPPESALTPMLQSFDTRLTPDEEVAFQAWKQQYAPNDSGEDYDLRGAFKAGLKPSPESGHWPDTFKKPNHPTFSEESIYAPFGKPGKWSGDQFLPWKAK